MKAQHESQDLARNLHSNAWQYDADRSAFDTTFHALDLDEDQKINSTILAVPRSQYHPAFISLEVEVKATDGTDVASKVYVEIDQARIMLAQLQSAIKEADGR